jgi:hypothetical protein
MKSKWKFDETEQGFDGSSTNQRRAAAAIRER